MWNPGECQAPRLASRVAIPEDAERVHRNVRVLVGAIMRLGELWFDRVEGGARVAV
jgi:hypothetical protein